MGAAKVEPEPLSVAVTPDDPAFVVAGAFDELELLELDPQALTPMAKALAVATASHMRDIDCFFFVLFIGSQTRVRHGTCCYRLVPRM